MFHVRQKRVAGVTLFEVLLVLFIAAFIAAAVATIYAKVSLTFKQNQLQSGIQTMTANIAAAYNGQYPSGAMAADTLYNAGLVPAEMYSNGPITPFQATDGWSVTGNTSTFSVTLKAIPSAVCSGMYQSLTQISNGGSLTIGNTSASPSSDVVALCGAAPTQDITVTVR
jgi:type II secretory pathway pseudopilin PulG